MQVSGTKAKRKKRKKTTHPGGMRLKGERKKAGKEGYT